MEIAFSGSYQNPTVSLVPGLIAPLTIPQIDVAWGEDIVFVFPDPDRNCLLRLVIREEREADEHLLALDYARTAEFGDIQFKIPGTMSRRALGPGIFFFSLLQSITNLDNSISYHELVSGVFAIYATASSLEVPAAEEDGLPPSTPVVPQPYPDALLVLEGDAVLNQSFGFFKAPNYSIRCIGTELVVQDAPTGAALIVDLAAYGGAAQNKLTTLPDGQTVIQTTFGTPLTLAANSQWQAKITQVGSTEPGTALQFKLKLQVA